MRTRARSDAGRPLAVILVLIVSSIVWLPAGQGSARQLETETSTALDGGGWSFNGVERCFMSKVNRARSRAGMKRLNQDRQLGYVARRHAKGMAANRSIYHDGNLGKKVTRWRSLGQNTGRGGSCKGVFRAFMNSGSHRSNVLGSWNHMGVGVEKRGGKVYVQQVFESRRDPGNVYNYP